MGSVSLRRPLLGIALALLCACEDGATEVTWKYPDVAGTYDFEAHWRGTRRSFGTGVLTIRQDDRNSPLLTAVAFERPSCDETDGPCVPPTTGDSLYLATVPTSERPDTVGANGRIALALVPEGRLGFSPHEISAQITGDSLVGNLLISYRQVTTGTIRAKRRRTP